MYGLYTSGSGSTATNARIEDVTTNMIRLLNGLPAQTDDVMQIDHDGGLVTSLLTAVTWEIKSFV